MLFLSLFSSKIFRIVSIISVVIVVIVIIGYANYERLRAKGLEIEVKSLKQSNKEKDNELEKLSTQLNYVTNKYNMCEDTIEKMRNDYDKKLLTYTNNINKYSDIWNKYSEIRIDRNKSQCSNMVNMLNSFTEINKTISSKLNQLGSEDEEK